MPNTTSPSILNAATGLLGFCLVVITSVHLANKADTSLIDEFTSVVAMFLIFSCFFSFLAIRTKKEFLKGRYETIAEYLFLTALLGVMMIIVLLLFKVIQ
jgi:hypothetical protein